MQGEPEKEKKLKELTGTVVVPAFVFSNTKFLFLKDRKVLIGFENNRSEIEYLVANL